MTKYKQIEKLLDKGLSAKEIAAKVGTTASYVYTVSKNRKKESKEWDKIKVVSVEVMPEMNFWERLVFLFRGNQ